MPLVKVVTTAETEQIFLKWKLPLKFTSEDQRFLQDTIPVVDDRPGALAFPTPISNKGLNILNLRKLVGVDPSRPPSFFDHPWYLEESFGLKDCIPGWHVIQMDVVPESIEKPHNYYYSLQSWALTVPSAIEVVLMLFLHFELTGERLLFKKHTWCSDEASLGRFVTVGAFGRNGVFISSHPPAFASRGLGICGKFL